MPDHEDSLGGETFSGEKQQDPAEQSLGDGATRGGDTAAQSLGDQSTFGDGNVDDELLDDGMKLEDLSERYTEEGVLGKGGMGEVILATDTRLGRKVAIKRILGKAARSKTAVQRFLTEAQSMAELSHPNIVQIYDYGRATDGPFMIMECVPGGSLLDKCKAGPIELDEAVNIFGQLCDGLTKAHVANIIHRDIKPANVLMTEDGIPKLTDFGLAKGDTADTGMTMEGAVIGTLDFMPPEQRQAAELTDHRSDLWSLAATFYQMLTGKSPKIIRFSDVPTQLQDALGKALEESKEDRFQSALEMKEAVLQAATAGLNAARDLGEGECPSCGTTNPSDRKFCRNTECAASLEVDCLSCKADMPLWEGVCGSCGTKQDSLIEEAKEVLQRKHDEAEAFLNELKFDDALKAARVIGKQNDLRLQQFAAWNEEFTTRLEWSRTSEHARLEQLLQEAHTHEQAYDYEAGLQTLSQIAPSLKRTMVSGCESTAVVLTERLTAKLSRLKKLEGVVRERVTKRDIGGLLVVVNELLTLKPDRPEVQKLKEQLEKRDADQLAARDNAVKQTTQQLLEQQYAEALATLNTISEEVWDEQFEELRTKASGSLDELKNLRVKIITAVNGNQLKGLFPVVEECLALKADQDDLVKLKQDLINREAQMDARNQQIISQAETHIQQLQFDEAIQVLGTIPQEDQTSTTTGLTQEAQQLSARRLGAIGSVSTTMSNKNYPVTNRNINSAAAAIGTADNTDPWIQQVMDEVKVKTDIRKKKLVHIGVAAACVVASVVIVGVSYSIFGFDTSYFDKSITQKDQNIAAALAKGDWFLVLVLDPDNIEGLQMKAAAEKAPEIAAALDQGDWKTVLTLDPDNIDGKRMKFLAEKAPEITAALDQGDWKTVLTLDPDNIDGKRMKVAAEKAAAEKAIAEKAAAEKIAAEKALAEKAAAEKVAAVNLAGAPLINTIGMLLREIPAGTLLMGSPGNEVGHLDNETQHKVTISKAFYMQTTEVTQGQWKEVMGTEPWKGKSLVKEGANYAASYVSWNDAVAYCEKLSEKESVTYRLPTEAEWEYACRAGTTTRWSFGDDEKVLGDYAWWQENADDIDEEYAHQVGQKKSNAFGLYDMHGNVSEWCYDYYGKDYYKLPPKVDPKGPVSGSFRVSRGGSWRYNTRLSRSAFRGRGDADIRYYFIGFRLVRELD